MNDGREGGMIADFGAWLESEGWAVSYGVAHVDVLAERDKERLLVEAKGETSSPGLDVDTCYGQLLRRMTRSGDRYGIVVPPSCLSKVL